MFALTYMVALHIMVFFVTMRWSHHHAPSANLGAAELALLCSRQGGSDVRAHP
jgi:hypothetical protein